MRKISSSPNHRSTPMQSVPSSTSRGWRRLARPTRASPNVAASLGSAANLRVNEWMANPNGGPDWFELFNPNPQPVTIGGLYLTDDFNQRTQYKIPPLSFIGVGDSGFAGLEAGEADLPGHAPGGLLGRGADLLEAAGAAVMQRLGFSLDNLSLMALTLAVGFVVDDAIVVLENCHRHVELGKTPMQAALEGAEGSRS